MLIGNLCNNANLNNGKIIGNPTDGAILKFIDDNSDIGEISYKRIDETPLNSNRKMMSTTHRLDGENIITLVKGAPEIIIGECKYIDNEGNIEILSPKINKMLCEKLVK